MRPLVATNIQQAFRQLSTDVSDFDHDFQVIADSDASYERPFALHGSLTIQPVLYTDGSMIHCAQADYVGFYAFQQAVRCLLLGVNHHVAGDLLVTSDLYGPAVASYYTSAYHALHAFLALEGRVFFESPIWPIPSRRPTHGRRGPFIGLLTRNNSWVFESRQRTHRAKWREVRQAFPQPNDLPHAFHGLFDYMYQGVFQRGADPVDVIQNPDRFRIRLADRFTEFLNRIAETRHQSIYESFGSDPHVVEALWNRDAFSTSGIDNQSLHFGGFAGTLLLNVASNVQNLIEKLNPTPEVRTALLLSIHIPWFDEPQIDSISIPVLQSTVTTINDWINATVAAPTS
jgi:hypothetical protein